MTFFSRVVFRRERRQSDNEKVKETATGSRDQIRDRDVATGNHETDRTSGKGFKVQHAPIR
jgi:hypothetical protein